jgi:histone acetyltransferase HTATIP
MEDAFSQQEVRRLEKSQEFREYMHSNAATHSKLPRLRNKRHPVTQVLLGTRLIKLKRKVWMFSTAETAYLCSRCLYKYNGSTALSGHMGKCSAEHPSGKVIYREGGSLCVTEIDGEDERLFCQQLCILAQGFISRKTLYIDVEGYVFYVLTVDGEIAAFFSREKSSAENNLSCIIVFPPHLHKGYGLLLIDLSYILRQGGPERPLSRDGQLIYKKHWRSRVLEALYLNRSKRMSIREIAEEARMSIDDTIHGLELLGLDPTSTAYSVTTQID